MARKKIYKIKHYKTGYRRKRSGLKKVLLGLLIAGAVFAASFLIIGPALDAMYNKTIEPDSPSSTTNPVGKPTPPVVSSDVETNESEAPSVSAEYRLYRVTEEELKQVEKHAELVNKLSEEGFTAALIPIRTNENIYFETKNDLAIRTKSIVDVKLSSLIKALSEKGIKTYGEFSVFMDNAAPPLKYGTAEISMGIQFKGNLSYLFLDSVSDPEGTFWLSPDSPLAQEYLKALATDVSSLGLDSVILKNFFYVKNPNAYYKEGINRQETLKTVLSSLNEAFGETETLVETDLESTHSGKPDELGGKITDITSSLCLTSETFDENTLNALKALSGSDVTLLSKELSSEQIEALKEIGANVLVG